jgi:uncharacterized protein (DUF1330 family)
MTDFPRFVRNSKRISRNGAIDLWPGIRIRLARGRGWKNWPSTRTVLIEFPDDVSAMAWYRSEEYQRLAQHRIASSEGRVVLIKSFDDGDAS